MLTGISLHSTPCQLPLSNHFNYKTLLALSCFDTLSLLSLFTKLIPCKGPFSAAFRVYCILYTDYHSALIENRISLSMCISKENIYCYISSIESNNRDLCDILDRLISQTTLTWPDVGYASTFACNMYLHNKSGLLTSGQMYCSTSTSRFCGHRVYIVKLIPWLLLPWLLASNWHQ